MMLLIRLLIVGSNMMILEMMAHQINFLIQLATTGPVFRSLTPVTSNKRTFPALNSILNGTNYNKWEVLPSVNRTLNFKVTIRDNHTGGGSTNTDDMVVTVAGNSGPFTVTSPNTNVSWNEGSQHTVKWNVANTNRCAC